MSEKKEKRREKKREEVKAKAPETLSINVADTIKVKDRVA